MDQQIVYENYESSTYYYEMLQYFHTHFIEGIFSSSSSSMYFQARQVVPLI